MFVDGSFHEIWTCGPWDATANTQKLKAVRPLTAAALCRSALFRRLFLRCSGLSFGLGLSLRTGSTTGWRRLLGLGEELPGASDAFLLG